MICILPICQLKKLPDLVFLQEESSFDSPYIDKAKTTLVLSTDPETKVEGSGYTKRNKNTAFYKKKDFHFFSV